jgi:flagellar biosynthesis protein FlhB
MDRIREALFFPHLREFFGHLKEMYPKLKSDNIDGNTADMDFFIPPDFKFDIQRFASAESEGRTEKATEHKKKKAREEGRVALSKEIPSAVITLFCFITIYFLGNYSFQVMLDTFLYVFQNITKLDITDKSLFYDIFLIPSAKIFLPIGAIAVVVALMSNYGQIGFRITPKLLKPNFKKISPNVFRFFKNQVFSVTSGFNLVKSLITVSIIILVTYMTIMGNIDELKNLMFVESIYYSFLFITKLCFDLIIKTVLILVFLSIVDYMFVRWQYEEQLKMKKQEIKEEYKELYGDPNVRGRLRQMYQMLLSQKKMLAEVPKSDVVITNPTHFAVALKYDSVVDEAPRVTAKGQDNFAQLIKKAAKEAGVFMYENVPLAQTLYREVEVNDTIPRAMYGLVIQAYKMAYEKKGVRT